MKTLDSIILKKFIELASTNLTGEWLLVGGTLLPAIGLDIRSTVDIDFIGLGSKEKNQNLELFQIVENLGLPIETINQAASYIIDKIKYTADDLIVLKKTSTAAIFRPSLFLYIALKSARLTETDLTDCLAYIDFCKQTDKDLKISKIKTHLKKLEEGSTAAKVERINIILNYL